VKSLSASIVALAGILCFALGAHIPHDDTQLFVCGVGLVVAAFGLFVWFSIVRSSES
jgi:hypothetical protein